MATESEKRRRLVAFVFGLIECLFLAGGIYGWVALVFILKADGIFSHLCDVNSTIVYAAENETDLTTDAPAIVYPMCQAQDDRLNLVFTIGNLALQGSTLITGSLFDKFGLRVTRTFGILVYVAGCIMMGAASVDMPALVFPGLMCFGMGGMQLLVTNMQIGNFFTRLRLPVVTVYNAAFDTSSATPLLMKLLYERGLRRFHSFIALAVISLVLVSISTFSLLPKFKIIPRDQRSERRVRMVKAGDEENVEIGAESPLDAELQESESGRYKGPSLWQCVFTPTYALAVLWLGIIQIRFYMYLGTLNVWLQQVTGNDIEQISMYTNVFSAILMCGFLMGPLEGFILGMEERRLKCENMTYWRKLKTAAVPKFLCSFFGLILSICTLFPRTELLYVQFITMTAMRSFLYGLNAAFLFLAFPAEHFGKLFGILMTFNACTASSQYGLFRWAEGPPRDPYPVNIFLLVLVVVSFIQPLYLWFAEKLHCLRTSRTDERNGNVSVPTNGKHTTA